MNITEKKLENSVVELTIDVPIDRVEIEYKHVFDEISKNAKIDGFRKGKAPMRLVEAKYIEAANQDVATNLTRSILIDAIKEKKLALLTEPKYEYKKIARGEPFTFTATFEVYPTVKLGKYKQVHVNEKVCNVTDDDINREIENLRERFAEQKKIDDDIPVQNGDLAIIKLKRIDDIDEIERKKRDYKEYTIILGKDKEEHSIDKYIPGMKTGEEREIEIKYPKDYFIKELAGQNVKYSVILFEAKKLILPDLNDEFAKKFRYETMDEMKEKTGEYIRNYIDDTIKDEVYSEIIKTIVEDSEFDIPRSMVLNEMYRLFLKTQERLGYKTESIEQFAGILGVDPDELYNGLMQEALDSLQSSIVLTEISKKENIEVSEDDYRKFIEDTAAKEGKTVEEIEAAIEENDSRRKLENELIIEKTFDFLYSGAKIKKLKPVSYEEMIKEK